jgi:hypothetical protein
VRPSDVNDVVAALAEACGAKAPVVPGNGSTMAVPADLQRTSAVLTHPVFNTHHTELELQRYIKKLENKDFSMMHGMIPLGSCTMKLNAASTLMPLSWPEWGGLHPFAPVDQTRATSRSSPTERCAGESHGIHGREPATQQRRAGRIRRPAGDPCVPRSTRRPSSATSP